MATLQRGKIENNMKRSQKSWLRKRRRDAVSDRKNKCKERVREGGGTRQQQQRNKEGRGKGGEREGGGSTTSVRTTATAARTRLH